MLSALGLRRACGGRRGGVDIAGADQGQHAIECDGGPFLGLGVHGDLVDDFGWRLAIIAARQLVEHPQQMRHVDAIHGGAQALTIRQHAHRDITLRRFVGQAIDHVNFRADGPTAAGFSGADRLHDAFGRAGEVRFLHDAMIAFRVNHHRDVGPHRTDLIDVFGPE